MIKNKLYPYIEKYINEYLHGFSKEQLNVGLMNGTIKLEKLNIRVDKVNQKLDLSDNPFWFKSGSIKNIQVTCSLMNFIGEKPLEILIENIDIILSPSAKWIIQNSKSFIKENDLHLRDPYDPIDNNFHDIFKKKLNIYDSSILKTKENFIKFFKDPSKISEILNKIMNNCMKYFYQKSYLINLKIKNVHIRFEDDLHHNMNIVNQNKNQNQNQNDNQNDKENNFFAMGITLQNFELNLTADGNIKKNKFNMENLNFYYQKNPQIFIPLKYFIKQLDKNFDINTNYYDLIKNNLIDFLKISEFFNTNSNSKEKELSKFKVVLKNLNFMGNFGTNSMDKGKIDFFAKENVKNYKFFFQIATNEIKIELDDTLINYIKLFNETLKSNFIIENLQEFKPMRKPYKISDANIKKLFNEENASSNKNSKKVLENFQRKRKSIVRDWLHYTIWFSRFKKAIYSNKEQNCLQEEFSKFYNICNTKLNVINEITKNNTSEVRDGNLDFLDIDNSENFKRNSDINLLKEINPEEINLNFIGEYLVKSVCLKYGDEKENLIFSFNALEGKATIMKDDFNFNAFIKGFFIDLEKNKIFVSKELNEKIVNKNKEINYSQKEKVVTNIVNSNINSDNSIKENKGFSRISSTSSFNLEKSNTTTTIGREIKLSIKESSNKNDFFCPKENGILDKYNNNNNNSIVISGNNKNSIVISRNISQSQSIFIPYVNTQESKSHYKLKNNEEILNLRKESDTYREKDISSNKIKLTIKNTNKNKQEKENNYLNKSPILTSRGDYKNNNTQKLINHTNKSNSIILRAQKPDQVNTSTSSIRSNINDYNQNLNSIKFYEKKINIKSSNFQEIFKSNENFKSKNTDLITLNIFEFSLIDYKNPENSELEKILLSHKTDTNFCIQFHFNKKNSFDEKYLENTLSKEKLKIATGEININFANRQIEEIKKIIKNLIRFFSSNFNNFFKKNNSLKNLLLKNELFELRNIMKEKLEAKIKTSKNAKNLENFMKNLKEEINNMHMTKDNFNKNKKSDALVSLIIEYLNNKCLDIEINIPAISKFFYLEKTNGAIISNEFNKSNSNSNSYSNYSLLSRSKIPNFYFYLFNEDNSFILKLLDIDFEFYKKNDSIKYQISELVEILKKEFTSIKKFPVIRYFAYKDKENEDNKDNNKNSKKVIKKQVSNNNKDIFKQNKNFNLLEESVSNSLNNLNLTKKFDNSNSNKKKDEIKFEDNLKKNLNETISLNDSLSLIEKENDKKITKKITKKDFNKININNDNDSIEKKKDLSEKIKNVKTFELNYFKNIEKNEDGKNKQKIKSLQENKK